MSTYTVSPMSDSKRWKVEKDGRRVSKHNKKSAAVDRARKLARKKNGHVAVQGRDGRFQRRFTPR